jgi:hypothetical protein
MNAAPLVPFGLSLPGTLISPLFCNTREQFLANLQLFDEIFSVRDAGLHKITKREASDENAILLAMFLPARTNLSG